MKDKINLHSIQTRRKLQLIKNDKQELGLGISEQYQRVVQVEVLDLEHYQRGKLVR